MTERKASMERMQTSGWAVKEAGVGVEVEVGLGVGPVALEVMGRLKAMMAILPYQLRC